MITSNTSGSPKLTLKGGDNITITTTNDTATITAEGGGGGGDMYKSVYDTDGDNTVDNSEKVNSALTNGYGVMSLSYNGSSPQSVVIDTATLKTIFGGGGGGGDVYKVDKPEDNQVGVWTGDGTIEGDGDLTFDGSKLTSNKLFISSPTTGSTDYDKFLVLDVSGTEVKTRTGSQVLADIGGEPEFTKGNLTEDVTGLQFDNTRQVIGGAAKLSLTSGYAIPTTIDQTNWNQAHTHVHNDADTLITNEGKLDLESGSNKVMITSNTSGSPKLTLKGGDNITITTTNDTATITAEGGGGGGDMYKSVYDTDGDNTVDNSEKVNSALTNGYGVMSLSYNGSSPQSVVVDTATLKTVFGGGGGDNLGNHQASQSLDMNGYDITEGDDIYCQTLKATAGDGVAESAIEASSNGSRTTAIIERKTMSFYGIEYPLQLQAYGTSSNSDGQGVGTKYLGKDDAGNWETIGEYHVTFPENGNGKEMANMVWQLNSAGSLSSEMTLTPDSLIIQGLRVTGGTVRLPSLSSATSSNTLYVQANGLITKGAATSGTVTSVAMTVPESELGVSGTPITTSGTLALTWDNQTTNKVFAAPNGSTGTPSFRALVDNDIPNDITCSNYEPLLTKYNLSLGTGLSFTSGAGTGRILGGAATIGIASGYYLPLTTDQTNWDQAHTHVHNDADTLTTNEIQNLTWTASTRTMNISGGTGDDIDLFSQTNTNAGLVPGTNGATSDKFLSANGTWVAPMGSGDITSVALTAPTNEFDVTGSPGTSGDVSITLTWDSQTTNKVFAAPNGSTNVPTFRALVDNDIPNDITCSNYEPLLTKYNLSLGTGLSFTSGAGTGRILGGAATIGIASGYYLPLTTDQTNWDQAHTHVHNDADTLTTNEIQNLTWTASTRTMNISGGTGDDIDLFSQTNTNAGLVPGTNGATSDKFLSANGTWVAPSSGSTYTEGFGIDITSEKVSLGNSSGALSDPNADKMLWWEDLRGDMGWLGITTGLKTTGSSGSKSLTVDEPNIDHNLLKNYSVYKHYIQKDIDTVNPDLSTGLLKVTSGVLSSITDYSSNWNTAYTHAISDYDSDATNEVQGIDYTASSRTIDLSGTTNDAEIPLFATDATTAGLVPGSNTETTKFLRGDGQWAVPSSGGYWTLDGTWLKPTSDTYSVAIHEDLKVTNCIYADQVQGEISSSGLGLYNGVMAGIDIKATNGWVGILTGTSPGPTQELDVNGDIRSADTIFGNVLKSTGNIVAGNAFSGASISVTDDISTSGGDVIGLNLIGQVWLNSGTTNTIKYATDGSDASLEFYNEYDNVTAFSVSNAGDVDFNYNANVDGDFTVNGEDVNLKGDAPYIKFGDNTNDGTLSFYNEKDDFTVMSVNADSTVSANDDLLVYGETRMLGGWRQSVTYYPNQTADITMDNKHIVWIVDPDATGVELTAPSSLEKDGQTITIVNDNNDGGKAGGDYTLGFKSSGGTWTQNLDAMTGYAMKSATLVYSEDASSWFLIGFSSKAQ